MFLKIRINVLKVYVYLYFICIFKFMIASYDISIQILNQLNLNFCCKWYKKKLFKTIINQFEN